MIQHKFDIAQSAGMTGYNSVNPYEKGCLTGGVLSHIDWRLDQGMIMIFAEDTGDAAATHRGISAKTRVPQPTTIRTIRD
ncbi:hypothetical protein EDD16DRAFT_627937 [Pisolithus croceorrhizus]|nr:hypothetical protein EDD16DRAFT_627937 [Pisolithus croceorrhizus]